VADRRARIRAVLFDLGGTLVDERDYDGWVELARRFYFDLEPDALTHAFQEVEQETDAVPPPGDREARIVEFWRRVLARASEKEVSAAVAEKFLRALRAAEVLPKLYSDTRRCLDQLRSSHRELGVVSNSTSEAVVRRILDRVGIVEYFARVVSSGTEGVAKPDPEIFLRAVKRMNVRPDEALFVGNLAFTDAKGAAAAGLHSLWLNRAGFGLGDDPPEIMSLLEVPLWVTRLERGEG
jgi:HAD superfamily hydrolase (TIGR01509 family)